jgi:uncharacterized protein (UPF0335 family)
MLKLALGVVLAAGLAVPAMAQENFPDVPTGHWAYEALRNLKDKVLFGYPDGLYRGNRPMSRYEFAVAINQLYQMMMGRVSGLEDQIKELEAMLKRGTGGGDTAGLQGLRDQLAALTKRVEALEAGHAELKKLAGEFEKELASLGVDVDAMKKDIADLDARVTKLEKIKPNVAITGDATLLVVGGYSEKGNFGLSPSGESLGVGRGSYAGNTVGVNRDLNVTHEAAVSLASTNETGPKFKGTFVLGNQLVTSGSLTGKGAGPMHEGDSDLYIDELTVSFDHSLFGRGFSAVVGRYGHSNLDYVLKRPDNTPYLSSSRYDDGKIRLDGAALTFKVGGSPLNVFLGRTQAESFDATALTPYGVTLTGVAGVAMVNRLYGFDGSFKLGPVDLALAAMIADSDDLVPNQGKQFNNSLIWGAEGKFHAGGLKFKAGAAESVIRRNEDVLKTTGTYVYYGSVEYARDKWGVTAGYRDVQPYFVAPGSWGSLGTITNPTGIQGYHASLWLKASDSLKLTARGDFYEGRPWNGVTGNVGIGSNDDVNSLRIGAEYKVSDTFGVDASYENVDWRLANAADPYQRWFTLGFNWTLSGQASARLFWQYSDADDKGTGAFTFFGLGANRFKGGAIGTQLSIKF